MPLKDLFTQIEIVRDRIKAFPDKLRKSEALTRYVLIDPVLRSLGWDTEDPTQVQPEFSTEQGRPDYALLWNGKPHIMVEAKSLNGDLEKAIDKGFQYCWKNKVPFYVVTDGNVWEIYDLKEMGGKQIVKAILTDDSAGVAARSLLALWHPAMPVIEIVPPSVVAPRNEIAKQKAQSDVTLPQLLEKLKRKVIPSGAPPPKRMAFPNGTVHNIRRWRDILSFSVEWVSDDLKGALPVPTGPRAKSYLIANKADGLKSPKRVGPFYVDMHASAREIVRRSVYLLEYLKHDPNAVTIDID